MNGQCMPPAVIMHEVFQRRRGQNGRQNQGQNRGVGPNQNRNVQPVG